jgi:hypothetical protein
VDLQTLVTIWVPVPPRLYDSVEQHLNGSDGAADTVNVMSHKMKERK